MAKIKDNVTLADIAVHGEPLPLSPPFSLEGIPLPVDILDRLIRQFLPGLAPGWVDLEREEITLGSVEYRMSQEQLGKLGKITILKDSMDRSTMSVSDVPWPDYGDPLPEGLEEIINEEGQPRIVPKTGGDYDGLMALEMHHKVQAAQDELYRKRQQHQRRVIQTLFNLLAKNRAWREHWQGLARLAQGNENSVDGVNQPEFFDKLLELLDTRFDEEELRTLCYHLQHLGVDYDNLPGEGKKSKARELIRYCERRVHISELIEIGKQRRPDISWPDRKNEQEITTEKRTEDGRITDERQYPTSWLDFCSKQLRLDTKADTFVRELQRYCYNNWMHPGWRTASIKRVRFLDGHSTWGEDDVWGVFFHKMTAHDGQLRQLPLTDDAFPQVLFLLSDIGGKYPLLVKIMPNAEDATLFAESFIARCQELWDSPDAQSLTSTEHSEITRLVNEMRTNSFSA